MQTILACFRKSIARLHTDTPEAGDIIWLIRREKHKIVKSHYKNDIEYCESRWEDVSLPPRYS